MKQATANSSASATPSGVLGSKRRSATTPRTFLEGAERVYTDGSASPQWYGTGTEDFYEGGWYFKNGTRYSDPLTGQPDQRTAAGGCADYCVAVYRLMLADSIGYHSAIRFGIEHGKRNMVQPDYSSTAFLYTQPDDTSTISDEVNPADPVSRLLHGYADAAASEPSCWSANTRGVTTAAPIAGLVRATQAAITFHVHIPPDNHGILLRRTSDQATGYQSADVAIDGVPAGIWLEPAATPHTAGSTTPTSCPTPSPPERPHHGHAHPDPRLPAWTASRYHIDALTGPNPR